MSNILEQLVTLSNTLGEPTNDYVILGEGNTSAQVDEQSFWVKASGSELRTVGSENFVQVYFEPILALLNRQNLSDDQVKQGLTDAKVDPAMPGHPSIETVLHALCLQVEGVNFVGHTHPTPVNILTCSAAFETAVGGRIFPDEIVLCGPAPALVSYADPGLPLAQAVRDSLNAYLNTYSEYPKQILLQNHGLIVLAATAQQVENITAMAVKTAKILAGTYALGGPHLMSTQAVNRIHTRPDEHYRQQIIGR